VIRGFDALTLVASVVARQSFQDPMNLEFIAARLSTGSYERGA
jgi:hypothetical protein